MRHRLVCALLLSLAACRPPPAPAHAPPPPPPAIAPAPSPDLPSERIQRGKASYYGEKFRGRKTASGARFDPDAFTAAHRTLTFGTVVDVKRVDTQQTVRVTITDRGPFGHADRIVDLSLAAAKYLQMTKLGVVDVELRIVSEPAKDR